MLSIRSYNDILEINRNLASLFRSPDDAVALIAALNGKVKDWVNNQNKQYWEVVRFVCERRGLLGKETKSKPNKLTREAFAEVLVAFCSDAVKGDSSSALKASMEKYKYSKQLSHFDKLPDAHLARKDVQDVENLLDNQPIEVSPVVVKPTLEDRVFEYLKGLADKQPEGYPQIVVRHKPNYEKIQPAISVERFQSEKFYRENTPSHIDAYEFVNGTLTMSKLNELTGLYAYCSYSRDIVKPYVVSEAGLLPMVKSNALERNIGYVRLNPRHPMTSDSYILPRKVNALEVWRQHDDMLMLKDNMDIPLLIMDGSRRETSFSYLYDQTGGRWNKTQLINVPYLQKEDIEAKAIQMIPSNEAILGSFNLWDDNQQIAINPYDVADKMGLIYDWELIHDEILGMFDVRTGHITLNINYWLQSHRMRFTIAHEIGHYLLHANYFKNCNITSWNETEDTLKEGVWMNGEAVKRAEYQANLFASYLLMPTLTTAILYAYYDQKFTGRKSDLMYYSELQPETWARYHYVVGHIAQRLQVSKEVATYRLIGMNFLRKS